MVLKLVAVVLHLADRNVGRFKENEEFDKERREATVELLRILGRLVAKHPEQRFSQILQNYGFVKGTRPINPAKAAEFRVEWQNEFYMEPVELLKRVQERLRDIENPEG